MRRHNGGLIIPFSLSKMFVNLLESSDYVGGIMGANYSIFLLENFC